MSIPQPAPKTNTVRTIHDTPNQPWTIMPTPACTWSPHTRHFPSQTPQLNMLREPTRSSSGRPHPSPLLNKTAPTSREGGETPTAQDGGEKRHDDAGRTGGKSVPGYGRTILRGMPKVPGTERTFLLTETPSVRGIASGLQKMRPLRAPGPTRRRHFRPLERAG